MANVMANLAFARRNSKGSGLIEMTPTIILEKSNKREFVKDSGLRSIVYRILSRVRNPYFCLQQRWTETGFLVSPP